MWRHTLKMTAMTSAGRSLLQRPASACSMRYSSWSIVLVLDNINVDPIDPSCNSHFHCKLCTVCLSYSYYTTKYYKISCCCDSRSYMYAVRSAITTTADLAILILIVLRIYHVQYSCRPRPLSGIAVVSMNIHLFAVLNWSLLLVREVCRWCLSAFSPFVVFFVLCAWLNDTSYSKMSEEANEKSPPGTIRYNFQPLTATLSATIHSVTDGRTDRQTTVSCQ